MELAASFPVFEFRYVCSKKGDIMAANIVINIVINIVADIVVNIVADIELAGGKLNKADLFDK